MLLHFALVLHFAAIAITFCVCITFCGDYYILRRNSGKFILQQNNKKITEHEDVPKQNLNCLLKVSVKY